jgi:hypothetical protein
MFERRWSFRTTAILLLAASALELNSVQPTISQDLAEVGVSDRLNHGEVVTGLKCVGERKYVSGRIVINAPPEQVWRIITNPFEFRGKLSPRLKTAQVMVDKEARSVMHCVIDVFPLPDLDYVVESNYEKNVRIEFHRVSGNLKDFQGFWEVRPWEGGMKTELTYSMFIDPGFFVPQWIVRYGVQGELPKTLSAVRKRAQAVYSDGQELEHETIMASSRSPRGM